MSPCPISGPALEASGLPTHTLGGSGPRHSYGRVGLSAGISASTWPLCLALALSHNALQINMYTSLNIPRRYVGRKLGWVLGLDPGRYLHLQMPELGNPGPTPRGMGACHPQGRSGQFLAAYFRPAPALVITGIWRRVNQSTRSLFLPLE